MYANIRKPTTDEYFSTRAEIMWQPVDTKTDYWYPVYYEKIEHTDKVTRCNVMNRVYEGYTVTCKVTYSRDTKTLTIHEGEITI